MTSRRHSARTSRAHQTLSAASLLPSLLLALVSSFALSSTATAAAEVVSDNDKAIYLIGMSMARQLGPLYLTDVEIEIVARGLVDEHAHKALDIDPAVYGPKIGELQEARAKQGLAIETKESGAYLAAQAKEKGAKTTKSGLIITEVKAGTGPQPTADKKVRVHYTGRLRDGTVFDSSVARGEPAEFPLAGVIPCWTEGVQMMKVGGKAKLVCPADIAYGERGAPPQIPPGAALTFDVELLGIIE